MMIPMYSNKCILIYGYGSIPIDTIFSGMNIHKSQLFWCELQGYKVLTHCHIASQSCQLSCFISCRLSFRLPQVLGSQIDPVRRLFEGGVAVDGGKRRLMWWTRKKLPLMIYTCLHEAWSYWGWFMLGFTGEKNLRRFDHWYDAASSHLAFSFMWRIRFHIESSWLVVWNMNFIFHYIYMGCHPKPIDELHHFSEG